ncbi:MAG: BofC C-terminal domain-containing protein [Hydrogenibacillus sp.]|nr:BofC C-terminal domain-containing protein [Hydrogenibacillus sp.]
MRRWLRRWLRRLSGRPPAHIFAWRKPMVWMTAVMLIVFPVHAAPANPSDRVDVVVHVVYSVGGVETKSRRLTRDELASLFARYPTMKLIAEEDGRLIYEARVPDLAPSLKEYGRIGLSPDGTLIFYLDAPEGPKIIETFFRLDLKRIEVALPNDDLERLKRGIPVHSMAEYETIVETYRPFSVP